MTFGYARVSTDDQNPALQLDALRKAECPIKIYRDELSGKNLQRPQLQKLLKAIGPGDVLVVWKLDRLCRSLRDLLNLLEDFRARQIQFRSLTESFNTSTPAGRAMMQMIGVFAEFERGMISERTKAGTARAKANGVKLGRKIKLNVMQIQRAQKLVDGGERVEAVAKLYNVGRTTMYRALQASA